ncbi:MAG: hypothetical protein ABIQ60_13925 [Burkholderiaceae bacterium]
MIRRDGSDLPIIGGARSDWIDERLRQRAHAKPISCLRCTRASLPRHEQGTRNVTP